MINLPYSGHVNPTLPLTKELVSRGHRVTYVNAESFREKIGKTGADFVPYREFPADISEDDMVRKSFAAAFDTAMSLPGPFDLLIYEMFFYPGIEVAKRKNIPCVRQFSQCAWSEATWAAAPGIFRLSARLIDRKVLTDRDARRMGFDRSSLRDGIIRRRPDLNIVYVPEDFQGCRESFDDSYLFVVPSPEIAPGDRAVPYEKMTPPIVYISLGSIISNRGFCKECIRAFGGKPVSVILNTGKVPPESLGRIPENIWAYSFVPQVEVLSHADVFLTHCGMNSINEALSRGVPMVAMPFLNDQIPNGRRIAELGLGKRVRSFPSRGRELYRAVCEVYADPRYRERARAMGETLRARTDWDAVIGRIEALVPQAHRS
jgi:MGT family glycosyltransferase